jgi:sulfhydrogenase subunit delta
MRTVTRKSRLAVWKFASCDGCQLTLLDCEDDLLALAATVEIAYFPEAGPMNSGHYDVSLVEGSISTPAALEHTRAIRRRSTHLVAIGACATAGGIQALRNFADAAEFAAAVYPHPEYLRTLATSTPIAEHVPVDFELRGCPIDKQALLEVLAALQAGRQPVLPHHSVCIECKARSSACVMVSRGSACLGPVTQAGCGALCPAYGRGCYGCYGPQEAPNPAALSARLGALGVGAQTMRRLYRTFTAEAAAFRAESERHGA